MDKVHCTNGQKPPPHSMHREGDMTRISIGLLNQIQDIFFLQICKHVQFCPELRMSSNQRCWFYTYWPSANLGAAGEVIVVVVVIDPAAIIQARPMLLSSSWSSSWASEHATKMMDMDYPVRNCMHWAWRYGLSVHNARIVEMVELFRFTSTEFELVKRGKMILSSYSKLGYEVHYFYHRQIQISTHTLMRIKGHSPRNKDNGLFMATAWDVGESMCLFKSLWKLPQASRPRSFK